MGHPSLKLDKSILGDLLDEKHYEIALKSHIHYRHECMTISTLIRVFLLKNKKKFKTS